MPRSKPAFAPSATLNLTAAEVGKADCEAAQARRNTGTIEPSRNSRRQCQHKRKLDTEHTARRRDVAEEVRLRVIAENKEYLAMVKERELKVQKK